MSLLLLFLDLHDYNRAIARPLSPTRAAAVCCAAINAGAAPVLVDAPPIAVPVALPVALPVILPVATPVSFPVALALVLALALLLATASTLFAVTVNVAFHPVQVYVAPLTGAVKIPFVSLQVPVAECKGVGLA